MCTAITYNTNNHYAIIGMSYVANNYPLYYDAINEKGLGMAGLNFPENADYKEIKSCVSTKRMCPYGRRKVLYDYI